MKSIQTERSKFIKIQLFLSMFVIGLHAANECEMLSDAEIKNLVSFHVWMMRIMYVFQIKTWNLKPINVHSENFTWIFFIHDGIVKNSSFLENLSLLQRSIFRRQTHC